MEPQRRRQKLRSGSPLTQQPRSTDFAEADVSASSQSRRKRAATVREPRISSEDSSDSTGDNWFSLQRVTSGCRSADWSGQEGADDKAYSLRPRKQSRTDSLTARTKAEAAVDNAEQKMAHAAQLVMAVQAMCGNCAGAPQPSSLNTMLPAGPALGGPTTSVGKQDESTGADGPADLSKCQNLPAPACPESIGRQLLLASPMSGEICLAEVLDVDTTRGQYHVLWQDGSDGWIHPQDHPVCWLDAHQTTGPMHAACPGVPSNLSSEALVGYTLEVFEHQASGFVPALVTSFDQCSGTHTLLSDDLGVQERPLADLTFRLLEPCESTLQTPRLFSRHDECQLPSTLDHTAISDWGSSSALDTIGSHFQAQEQQTPRPSCPTPSETQLQSAGDDALLHSTRINGALPDACLLPETARRIQHQSSADNLCEQIPAIWGTKNESTALSFQHTAADQQLAANLSLVDYPNQFGFGDQIGDDLDLERLWADEL